jgi:hypothetical protein
MVMLTKVQKWAGIKPLCKEGNTIKQSGWHKDFRLLSFFYMLQGTTLVRPHLSLGEVERGLTWMDITVE